MKTFWELREELNEATTGNVTSRHDVMHDNKAGAIAYVKKKAGSNVTVKHHGETPNGDHDISVTGHPKHVMKFVNHHEDEKYSLDHDGHKKYKKDFGLSEATGNVTSRHDVMGDNKAGAIAYVKKKAGSNVKVKHHGMTDNGDHDISVTGHPKHVMKFVNHHENEKYSLDHDGHKKYKKDFA